MEGIARSLLEFSSAEDTRNEERFAVDEPIKTIVSLLEPQYKASDIKISCSYKEKHVVKGRKIQFQDAFFNILNYILAETQGSGTVLIECAVRNGRIVLSLKSRNLIVADHIMKDVFEPVSGLYKEKRGFGFNLFVAKQLLERNGMTLSISSDKTNGSEFKIGFGEGDKRGI